MDPRSQAVPQISPTKNQTRSPLWHWGAVGLYLILFSVVLLHHEMWRDELQAWLIAKESLSLPELWRNTRYEGHPLLWFLTLYGLTRFTAAPVALQVLHLMVAVGAAGVLLRYAPFPLLTRLLMVFGYFFFYEYAVISRNYAQGVLLVFLFLAAYRPGADKPYLLLALLLALLCQTSIYGTLLALSLGTTLAFELWWWTRPSREFWRRCAPTLILSGVLLVAAVLFALYSMKPPADFRTPLGDPMLHTGFDPGNLQFTLSHLGHSYLPVPALRCQFWGTNFLGSPALLCLCSVALFVFFLTVFLRKPVVFFLYTTGTAFMLLFMYLIYTVSLRHAGHLYLLLVACLWLDAVQPGPVAAGASESSGGGGRDRLRRWVVGGILAAQVLAAGLASWYDLRHPFSSSRDLAAYIRESGLQNRVIVGDEDFAVSPLSAYLDRKMYYLSIGRCGSFIVWNNRRKTPDQAELQRQLADLAKRSQNNLLVILNYPLSPPVPFLALRAAFTASIAPGEGYYLYVPIADNHQPPP